MPRTVRRIRPDEWPVVERLWQVYAHDVSQFRASAPDEAGRFPAGRLPSYRQGPGRWGYLARVGAVPMGFALVREQDGHGVVGEFFVARAARGSGLARQLAAHVLADRPGDWEIAFQEENPHAARFWRRVAADVLTDVTQERRPVPGKPHLPPDVWLRGTSPTREE